MHISPQISCGFVPESCCWRTHALIPGRYRGNICKAKGCSRITLARDCNHRHFLRVGAVFITPVCWRQAAGIHPCQMRLKATANRAAFDRRPGVIATIAPAFSGVERRWKLWAATLRTGDFSWGRCHVRACDLPNIIARVAVSLRFLVARHVSRNVNQRNRKVYFVSVLVFYLHETVGSGNVIHRFLVGVKPRSQWKSE